MCVYMCVYVCRGPGIYAHISIHMGVFIATPIGNLELCDATVYWFYVINLYDTAVVFSYLIIMDTSLLKIGKMHGLLNCLEGILQN